MTSQKYTFQDLVNVMKKLRTPDTGCPWDLEQDFDSIVPYTIEEAYEVESAIKNKNYNNLKEELGDLLFQPIFHAQIAKEENLFDINDVINDVTQKMITRHPHVFGTVNANTAADVDAIWEQQKAKENTPDNASILNNVPRSFPALLRAQKLQKKAAKTGFEWDNIEGVLDKLHEEISELKEALNTDNPDNIKSEFGDIMFVLVNFARMNGFNAEEVMRGANDKFERRFRYVEKALDLKTEQNSITQVSLQEMEEKWNEAKELEKQHKL